MARRRLIVNADDFGRTAGINRGIAQAHEVGIVTSASLMVDQPAAAEAAGYARSHPGLGVGLHVDLGEWEFQSGAWRAIYEKATGDGAVHDEAVGQLERFRNLVGRDPTHLDSHQHAHRREPARTALVELASQLGVPLRHFDERVRYCGRFYGQTEEGAPVPDAVTADALIRLLVSLPVGVTELACHPGTAAGLDSSYREEREREVEALCDPRVQRVLEDENIELCSFAEIAS